MEIEDKSDAEEVDEFLGVAVQVLDKLQHMLLNDPVFSKQVERTDIYTNVKKIKTSAEKVLDNPERPRSSSFTTQQG